MLRIKYRQMLQAVKTGWLLHKTLKWCMIGL